MRSRILIYLMVVVAILTWSCENPETLAVSKSFNGNNLQTAFVDTFSVVTSTVQLDSVLTNNTGTMLLGKYHDDKLGWVNASSYMQIGSRFQPPPGPQYVFDSIAMIMHYNHYFVGDTLQPIKLNVYRLSEPMLARILPVTAEQKFSVYASSAGFYNASKFRYFPTPIVSTTVNLLPRKDSIFIRLPNAFGANWFRLAQLDSAHVFSNSNIFAGSYFYGLYFNIDPSTPSACVVGFKTKNFKIRLYYHQVSGTDTPTSSTVDFTQFNYQFNNIQSDRTGTALAGLKTYTPLLSSFTGGATYVQAGTGLVTRMDFPSLKSFFSTNTGVILNAAYLQVFPVQGSYPKNLLPPSTLQLFVTDNTNIPFTTVSGAFASIQYDYDYGINTYYNYPIFSYVYSQIKSNTNYFTPLLLGPAGSQGTSVSRVYIGDRFFKNTKIKLLIYYSYVPH